MIMYQATTLFIIIAPKQTNQRRSLSFAKNKAKAPIFTPTPKERKKTQHTLRHEKRHSPYNNRVIALYNKRHCDPPKQRRLSSLAASENFRRESLDPDSSGGARPRGTGGWFKLYAVVVVFNRAAAHRLRRSFCMCVGVCVCPFFSCAASWRCSFLDVGALSKKLLGPKEKKGGFGYDDFNYSRE